MSIVTTTGADFKAWMNADWGENAWYEGLFVINGLETEDPDLEAINDADVVEIGGDGMIALDESAKECIAMDVHFLEWKRKQTHEVVVISVPKENWARFAATIGETDAVILSGAPE